MAVWPPKDLTGRAAARAASPHHALPRCACVARSVAVGDVPDLLPDLVRSRLSVRC